MRLLNQLFLGRNGMDQLNKVLLALAALFLAGYLACAQMLLQGVIGFSAAPYMACRVAFILTAVVCFTRAFSRNLERRYQENQRFLQWVRRWRSGGSQTRRDQRKEYKVFRCPSCNQKLRVPRGKGKVQVTCRQCGAVFEKKT